METKFNFNSAICTSRSQSERLLALGLKKETADMYRPPSYGGGKIIGYYAPTIRESDFYFNDFPNDIPAWSLGRLWELYWSNKVGSDCLFGCSKYMSPYEKMIAMIEYDIEDGTFNKEYLNHEN